MNFGEWTGLQVFKYLYPYFSSQLWGFAPGSAGPV